MGVEHEIGEKILIKHKGAQKLCFKGPDMVSPSGHMIYLFEDVKALGDPKAPSPPNPHGLGAIWRFVGVYLGRLLPWF